MSEALSTNGYKIERQPIEMPSDIEGQSSGELERARDITEEAHRKLAETVDLAESKFGERLGRATEAHIVHVDTASLPIVGFSERELTDQQLHLVANTYKRFVDVVGEDNANKLKASVVITPGGQIEPGQKAIANADSETRIIRIAEDLFIEDLRTNSAKVDDEKNVGKVHPVRSTLMHELGHDVEFAAMENAEADTRLMSELFQESGFSANFRAEEYELADQLVVAPVGDKYAEKPAREHYGEQSVISRPSKYSAKALGEYFAETFMIYALNPNMLPVPLKDFMQHTIDQRLFVQRNPGEHTHPAYIEDVF